MPQLRTPTSLAAHPVEPQPRRTDPSPETFPKGRVCAAGRVCPPGTTLSIYHEGPSCHACEQHLRKLLRQAAHRYAPPRDETADLERLMGAKA